MFNYLRPFSKAALFVIAILTFFLQLPAQEEFVGPFSSWENVKTQYGAVGDGITDDTTAIQNGLNAVGTSGHSSVLFFPAGTYKITRGLSVQYKDYISILGADPTTTTLKWAGAPGGTLFLANGVGYSRWGRITYDGNNTAAIAFAHKWNKNANPACCASINIEHADDVFKNAARCLVTGDVNLGGVNDDDIDFLRAKFVNCTDAGVSIESQNALNLWFWDCEFTNNSIRAASIYGVNGKGGNFGIFRSLFQNSRTADIYVNGTRHYSFIGNTSSGSNQFFRQDNLYSNGEPFTFQNNTILDTIQPVAISVGGLGPIALFDNSIRSKSGAGGPAVLMSGSYPGQDAISIGNSYTVANAVSLPNSSARLLTQNDQIVPYGSISGTLPTLPGFAANLNRKIFEVSGFNGAAIQSAINAAVASGLSRAVVHLPSGTYTVSSTISVPASDIQIVGDGWNTLLNWTGSANGTVIDLLGPSKVVVREIKLVGNANGISVENADQPGAQVYTEGFVPLLCGTECILSDKLNYTRIENHSYEASLSASSASASVNTVGPGGAPSSVTAIFGGITTQSSGSPSLYLLSKGGQMVIRDVWFEGAGSPGIANLTDTGTFTFWSSNYAPDPNVSTGNAFTVNGFTGNVTTGNLFTTNFGNSHPYVITNEKTGTNVLIAGAIPDNTLPFLSRTGPIQGTLAFVNNKEYSAGDIQIPNQGDPNPPTSAFLNTMFAQLRNVKPSNIYSALPAGVTDVRLMRVSTLGMPISLWVKSGGTQPGAPVITSPLSAAAVVGSPFSYVITATNSPTSFGATGLPAGLTLDSTTGIISGTPIAAGANSTSISASNATGTGVATLAITVSQTQSTTIRSNSGGLAYTDSNGNVWAADSGFSAGSIYSTVTSIKGTADPALYQDVLWSPNTFQYQWVVPNGKYTITLKFAEIYYTQAGQRVFNIVINGQTVLNNFDTVAQAGTAFTAVDKSFPVTVSTGLVTIQFVPVVGEPAVGAIAILPQSAVAVTVSPGTVTLNQSGTQQFTATVNDTTNTVVSWSINPQVGSISSVGLYTAPASITSTQTVTVTATSAADSTKTGTAAITLSPAAFKPILVNSGGSAYTDTKGSQWATDNGFNAGSTYSTTNAISGTADPKLYQDVRWNASSLQYQWAVPNGNYKVTLKCAEVYYQKVGQRVFNIVINGQTVLANFDAVGQGKAAFTAVDKVFSVGVTTGQIRIQLVPVVGEPAMAAIGIAGQ